MRWGEWLVKFRAVSRADAVLGAACDELNLLASGATNDPGPVMRIRLQVAALELLRIREQLRHDAAPVLGDKRYLQQQMELPELPEVGSDG